MFWACRRPWTGQLCSWRPCARAWQGQICAHTAQTCLGLHVPEALPRRPQKTLWSRECHRSLLPGKVAHLDVEGEWCGHNTQLIPWT